MGFFSSLVSKAKNVGEKLVDRVTHFHHFEKDLSKHSSTSHSSNPYTHSASAYSSKRSNVTKRIKNTITNVGNKAKSVGSKLVNRIAHTRSKSSSPRHSSGSSSTSSSSSRSYSRHSSYHSHHSSSNSSYNPYTHSAPPYANSLSKSSSKPSNKPQTWKVRLGPKAYKQQINEIEKQTGSPVKVSAGKNGIYATFNSNRNFKNGITITSNEAIERNLHNQELENRAEKIYDTSTPLQKAGLHLTTLFSKQGMNYLFSFVPGGKSPKDYVKNRMVNIMKTKKKSTLIRNSMVGSLVGSPTGIAGTSILGGEATGVVLSKLPSLAPAATIVGGYSIAKEGINLKHKYNVLRAKKSTPSEMVEGLGPNIARDTIAFAGFTEGYKDAVRSLSKSFEILERDRRGGHVTIGRGKLDNPIKGSGVNTERSVETNIFTEPTPVDEWTTAVKKGETIEENNDFLIKRYHDYDYLVSKKPTGLNVKRASELKNDLIDTLRGENIRTMGARGFKGDKEISIFAYKNKEVGIPIERAEKPTSDDFKILGFKGKGGNRNVLKDLSDMIKVVDIGDKGEIEAPKEAPFETPKEAPVETKGAVGSKAEEGLLSLGGSSEIGNTITPFAIGVDVSPVEFSGLSFAIPGSSFSIPKLIPKKVFSAPKSKITPKTKLKVEHAIKTSRRARSITRRASRKREIEKLIPSLDQSILTGETTGTTTSERSVTKEKKKVKKDIDLLAPMEINTTFGFGKAPKFSLPKRNRIFKSSKVTNKLFGQELKYEPSLLGVMLKKKKKNNAKVFTGLEIRGI